MAGADKGFNWATAANNALSAATANAGPVLALPAMATSVARPLVGDFTRGLGMLAHLVAPAPTPPPTGTAAVNAALAPAGPSPDDPRVMLGQKVAADLGGPQTANARGMAPIAGLQGLAALIPGYSHPLDAKNAANQTQLDLAHAIYAIKSSTAQTDAERLANLKELQDNVSKAQAISPQAEALAGLLQNSQPVQ